jgi:hypothetical protein
MKKLHAYFKSLSLAKQLIVKLLLYFIFWCTIDMFFYKFWNEGESREIKAVLFYASFMSIFWIFWFDWKLVKQCFSKHASK